MVMLMETRGKTIKSISQVKFKVENDKKPVTIVTEPAQFDLQSLP